MIIIKRQAVLLALMISLLFCGCGGNTAKAEESFLSWREGFLQQGGHNITADVRFSADGTVSEYTLEYVLNSQEETVEILAPELIANVKAHIEGEASRLSYDGVILDAGHGNTGLSPMNALPVMIDFIEKGHLESSWTEKKDGAELIVTELELDDGSKLTLWQNAEDMAPLCGEIRGSSAVELYIEIDEIN